MDKGCFAMFSNEHVYSKKMVEFKGFCGAMSSLEN